MENTMIKTLLLGTAGGALLASAATAADTITVVSWGGLIQSHK